MPNGPEHCKKTLKMYGVTGKDIHDWMDEYYKIEGIHHRALRHNRGKDLPEVIRLFGPKYGANMVEKIFMLHLRMDYKKHKLIVFARKTKDFFFSKSDILKMYEQANLTERYVLMVGKSLGLRLRDFMDLTYGKFRGLDLTSEAPISIGEIITRKCGAKAHPFLDLDAIPIVKAMLERGKDESNETRILDYDEKSLSQLLNRLFEKAHLERHNRIVRFTCLRNFLVNKLNSGQEEVNQIIGKRVPESAYISQNQLKDIYVHAMKDISCLDGNNETRFEKLLKRVEELSFQIKTLQMKVEKI